MTSRLPRYEAKCVQRRCFQCGPVPLRSDIKGTELPPANILKPLERQLIALQLCRWQFLYNETLQTDVSSCIVEIVQKTTNLGTSSPLITWINTQYVACDGCSVKIRSVRCTNVFMMADSKTSWDGSRTFSSLWSKTSASSSVRTSGLNDLTSGTPLAQRSLE